MTEPRSIRATTGWVARAVQVRLRFLLVLGASAVVIGGWDTWRTYWDRWIAPAGHDSALGAVSGDTEYFCPMDPGVLSDWPGKCSVCNMALVRRSRGDMTPLPTGVVARVQLSPSRVQLGGIRSEVVGFMPLERATRVLGFVVDEGAGPTAFAALGGVDRSELVPRHKVTLSPYPPSGNAPIDATLARIESDGRVPDRALFARSDGSPLDLAAGSQFMAQWSQPASDREPFRSMPSDPPPLKPKEPRALYLCGDHLDVLQLNPGTCPKGGNALVRRPLNADQRMGWWCPAHPQVTGTAGMTCDECEGMPLVPRVVTYRPKGQVLAVPETAVIDTGARRVVYVESMPGTFDAVEVVVGPRCGSWYPVVSGLEAGQKVAAHGAFLIDAETRLNPSLASAYFGASTSAPPPSEGASKAKLDLSGLSGIERDIVAAQKTCPITRKLLGSMGSPVKVRIGQRTLFVCCEGCVDALTAQPDKYLKAATAPAHHP